MLSISKSFSISSNIYYLLSHIPNIFYLLFEIKFLQTKTCNSLTIKSWILFHESFLMSKIFVINVLKCSSLIFFLWRKNDELQKIQISSEVEKSRFGSCFALVKQSSTEPTECLNTHLNIQDLSQWSDVSFCLERQSVISIGGSDLLSLLCTVSCGSLHCPGDSNQDSTPKPLQPLQSPGDSNQDWEAGEKDFILQSSCKVIKKSLLTSCLWSSPEKHTQDYEGGTQCILPKDQCISEKQNHTRHAKSQRRYPMWLFLLSPTHFSSIPLVCFPHSSLFQVL